MRNKNRLGFSVWDQTDLLFVPGSKSTAFGVRAEKYFLLVYRSKLTCFLCADDNGLFLVWGSIDLVLCGWSKLTWFLNAGRKSLGFGVNIDFDLVFVWVVETNLISVRGVELELISPLGLKWVWLWGWSELISA